MRIAIVGAGAIGGTMAALLERGGHRVTVTARGDQLAAIRTNGIQLTGAWGDYVAKVRAMASLSSLPFAERSELVIVATKAQDAHEAIEANRAAMHSAPVLIVQNGLDGVEEARRLLRGTPVAGGLALFAAQFVHAGAVDVTAAGTTYLGPATDGPAREIATTLTNVMPVSTTENFAGCQWTKLIVNELNALPAVTGWSVQRTVDDPRMRTVVTDAMREAVRCARKDGIRFGALQGLDDRLLRVFARAPLGLAARLPRRMAGVMGDVPNLGSTLQSIRRGRRTEIDYLAGAVVATGQRAGFPTPVNSLLVELVHEVERTGRFFTPTEVASRYAGATL